MKIKLFIIIVCLFFTACKRDPTIFSTKQQIQTGNQSCTDTTHYPIGDTLYNMPRFNPSNSDEIIYLQGIQSLHKTQLVRRNLTTGQETFIVNNVWQMSDWSVKDWIVFNHADNQVWKIKSNGDSLTLITTNMQGGLYAIWSPDGNKIAYKTGWPPYTLICDANGNYLDSLPYQINYLTQWSNDGLNICGSAKDYFNVVYQNVYTHQATQLTNNIPNATYSNMVSAYAIGWVPNYQDIIWASGVGLYRTNILTKETTLLKTTCTNRYYTALSVSPDGQKIIAQRIDVASGLCLMDIDGKNEVIIK